MRELDRVAQLVGDPALVNSTTDTDTLPRRDISDTTVTSVNLFLLKNLGGLIQNEDLLNHWLNYIVIVEQALTKPVGLVKTE